MRRSGLVLLIASLLLTAATATPRAQSNRPAARENAVQRKPAAQAKDKRTNESIKGRVIGEGNRPVAGASILAIPVNFSSNPQAAVASLFRPVVSDADGKFEVDGLLPGAYTVQANSPGYVSSDSDSQSFRRPGETITLTLVKGGVITGRVTNSSGEPLVNAAVRAVKIREIDDKPAQARSGLMSALTDATRGIRAGLMTDDRGIYRIYGLAPGYYQVAAGGLGSQGFSPGNSPYDGEAPTYFPSSTIDTAGEIRVLAGDEITGIDIRYREHRGHSISGSVTGPPGSPREGFGVFLTRASSGIQEATTSALGSGSGKGFEFDAVLDGEYFVTAMGGEGAMLEGDNLSLLLSKPVRVTVSGGDVTGVELTVEPLASIEGRAVIEPLPELAEKKGCAGDRNARVEEVVIAARDNNVARPEDRSLGFFSYFKNTSPSDKGEFALRHLRAGVHRIDLQLPSDVLFIKSVTTPPASATAKPIDAAKTGLALKSGEKTRGLVVTLSEGAAGLRGKVVTGEENQPPAIKMRVHVIPAEPEAVDEVVRYFEAEAATDGSFSLMNIAPGKYWLVAREASEQEQPQSDQKPVAWDAGGRMGLRFEGDASKKVIELASCQRVADFVLKYTPLIKPSKPGKKAN